MINIFQKNCKKWRCPKERNSKKKKRIKMKKERNIWRDRETYCKGNKVKREGRMTGRTLQIARHVEFRIKMASDDNSALFPRNKYPISLSRHEFIHSLSFCSTTIIVFSYTNSLYRVEDEIISKVIYSEKR